MNNLRVFTAKYVSLNKSLMKYTNCMLYKQYKRSKKWNWNFKLDYVNLKSAYCITFKICIKYGSRYNTTNKKY